MPKAQDDFTSPHSTYRGWSYRRQRDASVLKALQQTRSSARLNRVGLSSPVQSLILFRQHFACVAFTVLIAFPFRVSVNVLTVYYQAQSRSNVASDVFRSM